MALHEIWIEGYSITGNLSGARKLGEVHADTFAEACDKLCSPPEWQIRNGDYDRQRGEVWGCRLFNNESDARRAFG